MFVWFVWGAFESRRFFEGGMEVFCMIEFLFCDDLGTFSMSFFSGRLSFF